jgi:hypothetical protein
MSKVVSLASLTSLFRPIDQSPYIFECSKNAIFDFGPNMRDLYYIVYPNVPRKYDEIVHGQSTSVFAFSKCELPSNYDTKEQIQELLYQLRKEARTNKEIFARTINSGVFLTDNDPRIEYELPPESPLNAFKNLSDEVVTLTKLPPEIDQSIEERMLCLSDDQKLLHFGHITGLYIFVQITGPNKFEVRQYTGSNNEKYETLFAYVEVEDGQVSAYVELDDNEAVVINRKLLINHPNFAQFIQKMFKFDSKKYIQIVRSSMLEQPKPQNNDGEENDDDICDFLGMPNNPVHSKSIINDMLDMYGNPTVF